MKTNQILVWGASAALVLGMASCGKVAAVGASGIDNGGTSSASANLDVNGDGVIDSNDVLNGNGNGSNGTLSGNAGTSSAGTSTPATGTSSGAGTSSATTASSGSTTTDGAVLAYFNSNGTVTLDINSTNQSGTGTQLLNLQDIRDSANAKNANVATILISDILVKIDPASVAYFAGYEATTVNMKISYINESGVKTLVGVSRPSVPPSITQLVSGISMGANNLLVVPASFTAFQNMVSNTTNATTNIIIDLALVSGTLPDATIQMAYSIQANAKVNL